MPAKPAGGFSCLPGNVCGNKVLMQYLHTEQVIDAGIELYLGCGSGFGCLVQLKQRSHAGMVQYAGVGYC